MVVDTERKDEGFPMRLLAEVALKGGTGRLTLRNEVVRGGLVARKELDSALDVEGGVSTLTDLTGDDVGVNFACFTAYFGGTAVEGGVKV